MNTVSPISINTPKSSTKSVIPVMDKNNNISFEAKPIEIKPNSFWEKKIKYLGMDFSSAAQRLISGVTALMTQPFIDLNNKRVDDDTRAASCARTIGKIISGMATGIFIRYACVELTKGFTKNKYTEEFLKERGKKFATEFNSRNQLLLPEKYKNASYRQIKNYRGALGTFAALVVMIGTNILIDAPLTTYIANKLTKNFTGKDFDTIKNKNKQEVKHG